MVQPECNVRDPVDFRVQTETWTTKRKGTCDGHSVQCKQPENYQQTTKGPPIGEWEFENQSPCQNQQRNVREVKRCSIPEPITHPTQEIRIRPFDGSRAACFIHCSRRWFICFPIIDEQLNKRPVTRALKGTQTTGSHFNPPWPINAITPTNIRSNIRFTDILIANGILCLSVRVADNAIRMERRIKWYTKSAANFSAICVLGNRIKVHLNGITFPVLTSRGGGPSLVPISFQLVRSPLVYRSTSSNKGEWWLFTNAEQFIQTTGGVVQGRKEFAPWTKDGA